MSEINESAIKKLKVNELKAELSKRGLAVKGKKDELIKRLMEAIEGGDGGEGSSEEVVLEEPMETEGHDVAADTSKEDLSEPDTKIAEEVETRKKDEVSTAEDESEIPDSRGAEIAPVDPISEDFVVIDKPGDDVAENIAKAAEPQDAVVKVQEVAEDISMETSEPVEAGKSEIPPVERNSSEVGSTNLPVEDAEMKESLEENDEKDKEKTATKESEKKGEKYEMDEKDAKMEEKEDKDTKREEKNAKTEEKDMKKEEREGKREEKKEPIIVDAMVEVEVEEGEEMEVFEVPDGKVVLDPYLSDIHFVISGGGVSGHNLVKNGFNYMWAGAMANKGAKGGKIGYEVKIVSLTSVDLPEGEAPVNAVRIGWSSENSNLQLGESGFSYGFESTGKICASSSFFEYGEKFGEGDVIGTYLDFESEPKTLTYTKNGENLGVAVSLTVNLDGKPLFPTVFLRNMKVELNFGGNDEPWFPTLESYTLIENADAEMIFDKSCKPPAEFSDCEVLLMVGLPSCGKTTWVKKFADSHRDSRFTIIGVKYVMERCKLEGKHRKKSDPNTEKLMKSVIQILTKLYQLCAKRKRNYVFDQNNVYEIAQQTKMTPFSEFQRKAVVIIPTHDNLRKRTSDSKRRSENIHEVPFGDLCDMKCQFHTPEVGDLFDEVIYPELDEKNAAKTIRDYKSDGARAMRTGRDEYYPKRKRFDDRSNYNYKRDNRFSGGRDMTRRDDGWKNSGSGYGGYGGNKGRSNYGSSVGGGYKGSRSDSKTYQDPYRRNTGSSGGYRSHSGYAGSSGNYRGSSGYGSSNHGSSNYGSSGGYGGNYSSGGNYNNYNQSNSNRGSSGGHWGGQYGSNYNQNSQNQQWSSSSGNWGGYNYSSGGSSNYGSGGGYSY